MRKFTSKKRTEKYISYLEEWVSDKGLWSGKNPDLIFVPLNFKEDILLIVDYKGLFIPNLYHHNHCFKKEKIDFLEGTIVEVLGYGYIPNPDLLEENLKLKCKDKKIRYLDAYMGQPEDFVFVPCPSMVKEYTQLLKYFPGKYKKAEKMLKRYYKKI